MQNNSLKYISDFDDVLKFIDNRKDSTKQAPEKKAPIPPRYKIEFLDKISHPEPSGKKTLGPEDDRSEILDKGHIGKELSNEERTDNVVKDRQTADNELSVEETSGKEQTDEDPIDSKTPDKEILREETSDTYPIDVATADNIITAKQTANEDIAGEEQKEKQAGSEESGAEESLDNGLLINDSSIKTSKDKETSDVEPISEETAHEKISGEEKYNKETFKDIIPPIFEKSITKGSVHGEARTNDVKTDSEVRPAIPSTGGDTSKPILFEKKPVKKILLVEDDMVLRKSIYYSLSEEGFYVVEADNGMDAIKKIQTEHFDEIVMYFQMQMLGGMELIRILRKDLGLSIPVTVRTSSGEKDADLESFTLMTN